MDIRNEDVFEECNFNQPNQDTEIFKGYTGLKFVSCPLINCILPPDAKVIECQESKKDFCYHLHPEMDLPEERTNCRHVTSTFRRLLPINIKNIHRKDTHIGKRVNPRMETVEVEDTLQRYRIGRTARRGKQRWVLNPGDRDG